MEPNRKRWNEGQQQLRGALLQNDHQQGVALFLVQHAMLHNSKISRTGLHSFDNELWRGLTEDAFRRIPPKDEHSIAWILFHISRIEDMTMNVLVAGSPQLYVSGKWAKKLKSTIDHSANKMDEESVARLSAALDMSALRDYRLAVGRRTREIARGIRPGQPGEKVNPSRLQKLTEEGAVTPEAMEIVNYWSKRTIAGLLLMPPTRHNFLHLNEAMRIKIKLSG